MHRVHIMTLQYVNNETGTNYKYEVVNITFTEGTLFVLCKDENGKIFSTQYSKESMQHGMVSIF